MSLEEIVRQALKYDTTDIHLSANVKPAIRSMGNIKILDIEPLGIDKLNEEIAKYLPPSHIERFNNQYNIDLTINIENTRIRTHIYRSINGISIAMRLLKNNILSLDNLGIPSVVKELLSTKQGLILVTGATGSGKSTTLAAMIEYLNENYNKHIVTIEDPIEFFITSNKSLITQREVGTHTHSFSNALRSVLREDPDIIMLGELRDLETIQLALTAAETGHLVLATLHTKSAAGTVSRIIDVFPAKSQGLIRTLLADTLRAVITQSLIPMKEQEKLLGAYEILLNTRAVSNLIREDKVHQILSQMQLNSKIGMCTMKKALTDLVKSGTIDPSILLDH